MAWAQDWHTSAAFYQPKQAPRASQIGGEKKLQDLMAKSVGQSLGPSMQSAANTIAAPLPSTC